MTPDDAHLDLDALEDVLAEEAPRATGEHLADCADCRARLDELRAAAARVSADLAALPAVPMPDDIATRLHEALTDLPLEALADAASTPTDAEPNAATDTETATVTTLPTAAARNRTRWLPAAAAALVLLAGAGYGVSQLVDSGSDTNTTASGGADKAAGPSLDLTRNNSGTDYTDRASLSAAVPALLDGRLSNADTAKAEVAAPSATTPQRGAAPLSATMADPLARLRDNAGLADCLIALLPPDDPSVQPLAIDYASFRGQPAMVVVLPGIDEKKLDIYVVGAGCSQANDSLLFYTSVDKP